MAPALWGLVRDFRDEHCTRSTGSGCVWPYAAGLKCGTGSAARTAHSGVVGEEPEQKGD